MKYLKNIWIRAIISLLAGGITAEFIHISTGDPNREGPPSLFLLILALIVFGILSLVVKKSNK